MPTIATRTRRRPWRLPVAIWLFASACSPSDYGAFRASHEAIRPAMTLAEAFDAGLADYLVAMRTKNIAGATLSERQPANEQCVRHVLDITWMAQVSGEFIVRVYCNDNAPSSAQVEAGRSFRTKRDLIEALGTTYLPWARSMTFRVESPPKRLWGVYDHYTFTTGQDGKVSVVSRIATLRTGRGLPPS
jgi:hypothetical protein